MTKLKPGMWIRENMGEGGVVWEVLPYKDWNKDMRRIGCATAKVITNPRDPWRLDCQSYFHIKFDAQPHFVIDDSFEAWAHMVRLKAGVK